MNNIHQIDTNNTDHPTPNPHVPWLRPRPKIYTFMWHTGENPTETQPFEIIQKKISIEPELEF